MMMRIEHFVVLNPPLLSLDNAISFLFPPHYFGSLDPFRVTDHTHNTEQHHTTQQTTATATATKEKAETHGTGKGNTQCSFLEGREEEKHTCVCACVQDSGSLPYQEALVSPQPFFDVPWSGSVSYVDYLVSSTQNCLVISFSEKDYCPSSLLTHEERLF